MSGRPKPQGAVSRPGRVRPARPSSVSRVTTTNAVISLEQLRTELVAA